MVFLGALLLALSLRVPAGAPGPWLGEAVLESPAALVGVVRLGACEIHPAPVVWAVDGARCDVGLDRGRRVRVKPSPPGAELAPLLRLQYAANGSVGLFATTDGHALAALDTDTGALLGSASLPPEDRGPGGWVGLRWHEGRGSAAAAVVVSGVLTLPDRGPVLSATIPRGSCDAVVGVPRPRRCPAPMLAFEGGSGSGPGSGAVPTKNESVWIERGRRALVAPVAWVIRHACIGVEELQALADGSQIEV